MFTLTIIINVCNVLICDVVRNFTFSEEQSRHVCMHVLLTLRFWECSLTGKYNVVIWQC